MQKSWRCALSLRKSSAMRSHDAETLAMRCRDAGHSGNLRHCYDYFSVNCADVGLWGLIIVADVVNKIVIIAPTVDLVCECIIRFHMVMWFFQVVQCLCVQLTKTYFVFPRLSVPVRQSIYLPVSLSACPSIRLSAGPSVRMFFFSLSVLLFLCEASDKMRGQRIEQARERKQKANENEQNEWAKIKREQSAETKKPNKK